MSLTLPSEYKECFYEDGRWTIYEIRAKGPGREDDEGMVCVNTTADDKYEVQYWPEGAIHWERYAEVDTLEDAIHLSKTIIMLGLSTFL